MAQFSAGFFEDDDEQDNANALPMASEQRASQDLQSPEFQQPAPEPAPPVPTPEVPAPVVTPAPELPAPPAPRAHQALANPVANAALLQQEQRAEAQQQAGYMRFLKDQGLETSILPDGSEVVATHDDGAPKWREDVSEPMQNDAGRWVKRHRTTRGETREIDLLTPGLHHRDDSTGNLYVTNKAKERIVIGVDTPYLEQRKLKAERYKRGLEQQADSLAVEQLRADLEGPEEALRQYRRMSTDYGTIKQIEEHLSSFQPGVDKDADEEARDMATSYREWLTKNPEYRTLRDQVEATRADITSRQQRMRDRKSRAITLSASSQGASVAALLPPTLQPSPAPTAPGESSPDEVDDAAIQTAVEQGVSHTDALKATLTDLKSKGISAVGSQKLDDILAKLEAQTEANPDAGSNISYTEEIWRGLKRGHSSMVGSVGGLLRMVGFEDLGRRVAEDAQFRDQENAPTAGLEGFHPASPRWWAAHLSEVVPQLATQVLAAVATSGASIPAQVATFAATSGGITAGQVYNEAANDRIEKGETPEQARNGATAEALLVGTISSLIDILPGSELLSKNPAVRGVIGKVVRSKIAQKGIAGFLSEGTSELGQEIVQDLGALGFRQDADRFKNAWDRYASSFVLGGVAGAGMDIAFGRKDAHEQESTPGDAASPKERTAPGIKSNPAPEPPSESSPVPQVGPNVAPTPPPPPVPAASYTDTLAKVQDIRAKLITAKESGDTVTAATLRDEGIRLQGELHTMARTAAETVPFATRKQLAKAISPDVDAEGNESFLASDQSAWFATTQLGREMRGQYLTPLRQAAISSIVARDNVAPALAETIVDQHVGMLAARDLRTVLNGGLIELNKAAALDQMGLLEQIDNGNGGTKYAVSDDALPLFPQILREQVKRDPQRFNFTVTHGSPADGIGILTRAGQDSFGAALQSAEPQPSGEQKPYRVMVRFSAGDGKERSTVLPVRATSDTEAIAKATAIGQRHGRTVHDVALEAKPQEPVLEDSDTLPAAKPPPWIEIEDESTLSDEGRKAAAIARRQFIGNRDLFRALGIDAPVMVHMANRSVSGIAMSPRGQLIVDPELVAEQVSAIEGLKASPEAWVREAMVEEFIHLAQFVSAGPEFAELYSGVWNDPNLPDGLKEAAAKSYVGFDQLSEAARGAEIVRMVIQGRWRGTITEAVIRALKKIVDFLRGIDVTTSPLLDEAVQRTETVLNWAKEQAESQKVTTRDVTPSDADLQKVAASKTGEPVLSSSTAPGPRLTFNGEKDKSPAAIADYVRKVKAAHNAGDIEELVRLGQSRDTIRTDGIDDAVHMMIRAAEAHGAPTPLATANPDEPRPVLQWQDDPDNPATRPLEGLNRYDLTLLRMAEEYPEEWGESDIHGVFPTEKADRIEDLKRYIDNFDKTDPSTWRDEADSAAARELMEEIDGATDYEDNQALAEWIGFELIDPEIQETWPQEWQDRAERYREGLPEDDSEIDETPVEAELKKQARQLLKEQTTELLGAQKAYITERKQKLTELKNREAGRLKEARAKIAQTAREIKGMAKEVRVRFRGMDEDEFTDLMDLSDEALENAGTTSPQPTQTPPPAPVAAPAATPAPSAPELKPVPRPPGPPPRPPGAAPRPPATTTSAPRPPGSAPRPPGPPRPPRPPEMLGASRVSDNGGSMPQDNAAAQDNADASKSSSQEALIKKATKRFNIADPMMGAKRRKEAALGLGVWMTRSGDIIPLSDDHNKTAARLLDVGDAGDTNGLDAAYRKGWARVLIRPSDVLVSGNPLTPSQKRNLSDWALMHERQFRDLTEPQSSSPESRASSSDAPMLGASPVPANEPDERLFFGPIVRYSLGRVFLGTADVLEKTPGLEFLGKAVRKHVDTARKLQGQMNQSFRLWEQGYSRAERKQALKEFEEYFKYSDADRQDDAFVIVANAGKAGKKLIRLWQDAAASANEINKEFGLQVFDSNTGKFRSIGTVQDYFPRSVKPEIMKLLQDPTKDLKKWREVVNALVSEGHIESEAQAHEFLSRTFNATKGFDYLGHIEAARQVKLPTMMYDYSFEAARRYLNSWAERQAQIQAYGQAVGKDGKDLFDQAIEKTVNKGTQEYIAAVRDRAYGVTPNSFWMKVAGVLNQIATATMLTNPITIGANLFTGLGYNASSMGMGHAFKGMLEMRKAGEQINDAFAKGILQENLSSMMEDADALDTSWRKKLSDITSGALKYTGYNVSEEFVRAHGLATARSFLEEAKKANERNPDSRTSRQYREFFERHHVDPEALLTENGEGERANEFFRSVLNASQGGYRFDQVPVYADTPVGRFLFKFGKWGLQQTRFFTLHVLHPLKKGNVAPMMRYLALTAVIGGGLDELKELLFGTPDRNASWEEIGKTLKEDQLRGLELVTGKAFNSMLSAGAFGALANYTQAAMDVANRSRFKNPLEPAGLASFKNGFELGLRALEQGTLTASDLNDFLRAQISLYRTGKSVTAKGLDAAGSDFKWQEIEMRRQDMQWLGVQTRRYADEIGVEASRTSLGRVAKTPESPVTRRLFEALTIGDTEGARKAFQEFIAPYKTPKDRNDALHRLQGSVRNRQPIRVGASSEARRELFMRWAERRLSREDLERVRDIDRTYRRTATALRLMKPEDKQSPLELQDALRKLTAKQRAGTQ